MKQHPLRTKKARAGEHQHVAPPSVLQEYIAKTLQSCQREIDRARTPDERREWQLLLNVTLWEVDASQKYQLTPSALAMIRQLKPDRGPSSLKALPGTGIWMMLNEKKDSNIYFSSLAHATASYLEARPHIKKIPKLLDIALARPWVWDFQVITINSHPIFYLYDAERGRWALSKADFCPVHRCEKLGTDRLGWPSWYICDVCRPTYEYWTSWFPVALMAVNLDFAETETRLEPKHIVEREIRKQRTDQGSKETRVTHTWKVITFDLAVQSPPPLKGPVEPGETAHPTWLEKAISDETVLYVDKHIEEFQRTFHHQRYVNMRGKTITVASHEKRIPVSVKRLKQTIYKAIATRG